VIASVAGGGFGAVALAPIWRIWPVAGSGAAFWKLTLAFSIYF